MGGAGGTIRGETLAQLVPLGTAAPGGDGEVVQVEGADGPDGQQAAPLVLLDVDGVLNAVTRRGDPTVWSDWRYGEARAGGRTWPIVWSPTVTGAVRSWRETGLADVRWLTTWRGEANRGLRELLDLPELPVVGDPDLWVPSAPDADARAHADVAGADAASALTGRWWKFDLVLELVAEDPGRPFVWIDDDLRHHDDVRQWLAVHTTSLPLAPQPDTGLTPPLLAQAGEWLRARQGPTAAP